MRIVVLGAVLVACGSIDGKQSNTGVDLGDPLAQAAQESFLRSGDARSNAERMAAGRAALLEKARVQPDALSLVNVLLTRGMEARALAPLLDGAGASLMAVEAKTPIGDGGKVMTLGIVRCEPAAAVPATISPGASLALAASGGESRDRIADL